MGWNHLSIPKLQRLYRWSLGMDNWFHPTFYNGSDYLFMLGFKLIHVSKRGPGVQANNGAISGHSDDNKVTKYFLPKFANQAT